MKNKPKKGSKFIIGITGSFGSGKSMLAGLLADRDTLLIDADKIARALLKKGSRTYLKLVNIFGKGILRPDSSIDRRKLSGLVFADKQALRKLNRAVHPQVIREIKDRISRSVKSRVVLDAPLLIEAGLEKICDCVVVVKISRQQQIKRLRKKLGFSANQVSARSAAQLPLSVKLRKADFIIDNSKGLKETRKQVSKIRRLLWKS